MDKGLKLLDRVGLKAHADKFPGQLSAASSSAWRSPGPGDGPDLHALRRAHLGPRPRDDQRGARRDGRAGPGGHDDDVRHPRDGLRQKVANRVIFMDQGRIVGTTARDAFFGAPRSRAASSCAHPCGNGAVPNASPPTPPSMIHLLATGGTIAGKPIPTPARRYRAACGRWRRCSRRCPGWHALAGLLTPGRSSPSTART